MTSCYLSERKFGLVGVLDFRVNNIFGQSLSLGIAGDYYTGVSVVTKKEGQEYKTTKGQLFEIVYPPQPVAIVKNENEEQSC